MYPFKLYCYQIAASISDSCFKVFSCPSFAHEFYQLFEYFK